MRLLLLSLLLFLVTSATAIAQAQMGEVIHRFGPGPLHPSIPLTLGPDDSLYGVTEGDAAEPAARVFRLTPTGRIDAIGVVKDYARGGTGAGPLTRDFAGNIWGITSAGGVYSDGIIFRISPEGVLRCVAMDVQVPRASRLLASGNGNVYGVAQSSSSLSWIVFRTNAASQVNAVVIAVTNLNEPALLLTTRADEMIGAAQSVGGGTEFFRLATDGTVTVFAQAAADIGLPICLVEGNDDALYGFSVNGGLHGCGAFFRLAPGSDAVKLFDFLAKPAGTLSLGEDGKFYGIIAGDALTSAAAFRLGADGAFENLGVLPGTGASGVALRGGTFYGTVAQGENAPLGAIVSFRADGTITRNVPLLPYGNLSGSALAADDAGNVYGVTTESGPDATNGMVFKISAEGVFSVAGLLPAGIGSAPVAGATVAPDGTIFGVTSKGADHGAGGVFRLDATGQFTLLGSFGAEIGTSSNPLCFAADGMLYGTCRQGGAHQRGTIYRVNPSGGIVKLADLDSALGHGVEARLTAAPDGALYGIARSGGPDGGGTILRITTQGSISIACDFPEGFYYRFGEMAIGRDGAFYGLRSNQMFRWPIGGSLTLHPLNKSLDDIGGFVIGRDGHFFASAKSPEKSLDRVSFPSGAVTTAWLTPNPSFSPPAGLVSTSDGRIVGVQTYGPGFIYQFRVENHAPTAANDRFSVRPGAQNLNVLANDSDADGDELNIAVVTPPAQGDAVVNADRTLSYTARSGFSGTDTFTYEVSDGYGSKAIATVEMFNTSPVISVRGEYFVHVSNRSTVLPLPSTLTDPDEGQTLTLVSVGAPAHGKASILEDNAVYRPHANSTGKDTFTYTVTDGFGGFATGEMHLTDVPFLAAGQYGGTTSANFPTGPDYLAGPLRITLSKNGSFTAVILPWLRIQGRFDADGSFRRVVKARGDTYLIELQLDPETGTITGSAVTDDSSAYNLRGAKEIYSPKNPSPQAGRYTFLLGGNHVLSRFTPRDYQFGTSYGLMNVSTSGAVRLAGRLADNAAWATSTRIYGLDQCSFRAYPRYPEGEFGFLESAIRFADLPTSDAAGEFHWNWFIPWVPSMSSDTPRYTVISTFVASRFTQPAPLLLLPDSASNARITYEPDGETPFPTSWEETLSWSATNIVTRADPAGPGFKIIVNGRTGLFRGSFRASSKQFPFFGAVLQKANGAGGYFLNGRSSGSVWIAPPP